MENQRVHPIVILLLDQVRRVEVEEARRLVLDELGASTAATVQLINDAGPGMHSIQWHVGETWYHLGTSPDPYVPWLGEGKIDKQTGRIGEMTYTTREEPPPDGEAERAAWMSHTAWMYVDAPLFNSSSHEEDRQHSQNVMRLASRLVDHRSVLLWQYAPKDLPKRVKLPTLETIAALRNGSWPE